MLPIFNLSAMMGGRTLVVPTTSYSNTGGQGNRSALITVTAAAAWTDAQVQKTVDGSFTASSAGSAPGGVVVPAGTRVVYTFTSLKFMDEIYLEYSAVPSNGAWKWQYYDGSNYQDLASFTWNMAGLNVALSAMPPQGATVFGLYCPGGVTVTAGWWKEIEFKIADGAV